MLHLSTFFSKFEVIENVCFHFYVVLARFWFWVYGFWARSPHMHTTPPPNVTLNERAQPALPAGCAGGGRQEADECDSLHRRLSVWGGEVMVSLVIISPPN